MPMKFLIYLLFIFISIQAFSQFDGSFKAKEVNYSIDAIEINISTTKLTLYKANLQKMKWTTTDNGESIAKFSVDLEDVINPTDSSSGEDPETLILGFTNTENYEVKFEVERLYNMEMFDYTNENLSYQEASLKIGSYNLMSKIGKTKNAKRIEITIKKSDLTADQIQLFVFKGKRLDFYELFATTYTSNKEIDYSQSPIEVEISQDVIEFTNVNVEKLEWENSYSDGNYIKMIANLENDLNSSAMMALKEEQESLYVFISNTRDYKITFRNGQLDDVFDLNPDYSTGTLNELNIFKYGLSGIGYDEYTNQIEIIIKQSDIRAKNIQICVFRGKKSAFESQFKKL